MIKEIISFFKKKENQKKTKIFLGILIALALFKNDLLVQSQASLGTLATTLSVGVILFFLGAFLIIIPFPPVQIAGGISVLIGVLTSGGSIWAVISKIPTPGGFPLWAVLALVGTGIFIFRRKLSRQYTY